MMRGFRRGGRMEAELVARLVLPFSIEDNLKGNDKDKGNDGLGFFLAL